MSSKELVAKIIYKVKNKAKDKFKKFSDLNTDTHINFNTNLIKISYIKLNELNVSSISREVSSYLSKMYLSHRFDLLGSGWVKNSYEGTALGVEGYRYDMNVVAPKSSIIKSDSYELIDWQKDFKSGFRWSEKKWYKDQRIGHRLGSDIKVPWELSRFQHLSQLAIFALVNPGLRERNLTEFKNQILDFIIHNPPRMGVNWTCTMDVGIRVANMLVAYDMFCQMDSNKILDTDFKQAFANSIYEHALHIVNNLEYSPILTSNHYLSDIAGLLFASAYLEDNEVTNVWLAFTIQEIISEMRNEFYEDGGNFESSTSYHRLSAELMVYSVALIMGLDTKRVASLKKYNCKIWKQTPKLLPLQKQEFKIIDDKIILPQWFIDRLYKIGRFTHDITKPNGEVPQFGDNDSGRFFRLSPNGEFLTNKEAVQKYLNLQGYPSDDELFWDENILNHTTLISAFGGIFNDEIFKSSFNFEKSLIKSMAKSTLKVENRNYKAIRVEDKVGLYELNFSQKSEFAIQNLGNFKSLFYSDSGIFIFKSEKFYLAVCVTPLGQNDYGGHAHNDKLSYELWIDGIDIARDPGTYLYTPLPNKRNEFRSTMAHNVPIVDNIEQNGWLDGAQGLFSMFKNTSCKILSLNSNSVQILLEYDDIKIIREFVIMNDKLVVADRCNKEFKYAKFELYSNGYGKVIKNV
ncbi:alginate lyase family protein [Campylobacter mucosalis]|uniref:alginate lyase family protein n=1 Tax=Campylobacter mucosalis TaxID=202 RepID=UPI001B8BE63C|nr:alginate lyase family protein [Campylobacter mucosalis]